MKRKVIMPKFETKEISILPDKSLMPKLGQTGYSVSQAISELVDNSIDARKSDAPLIVLIELDKKRQRVRVIDNGIGMNEQDAADSIKLAHSDKKNKLGEFGLGLKTAATSLGKKFSIYTTPLGTIQAYMIEYSESEWLKNGDWNKHEMKIQNGVRKEKTGTIITINDLNFKIYGNLSGNIRKDLATRFAPFIENKEVMIKVNTKWCTPEPLDLKREYHMPDGKEKFRFRIESGNEVWGWRGLLKRGSDKGEYGFRVFRRDRLISQNAKIGFNPHPEARQIIGEIHLDHVPVTHNKREFIEESPLFREIAKEGGIFWNFMRGLVKEARSSVRKTQISQGIIDKMEVQKENIMKAIKTLPELKEYAFPDLKERIKANKKKYDGIDNVLVEKRNPGEIVTIVEHPENVGSKNRIAKKKHAKKTYYITINGKRFKVEHFFDDLKTEDVLKDKYIDREKGIQVYTNTTFPAFSNSQDHVFYGAWNIAEALAEVMVEKNHKSTEEIIKIRDKILKKSSEITKELDRLDEEKKQAKKLKKEYEKKIEMIKKMENKKINL